MSPSDWGNHIIQSDRGGINHELVMEYGLDPRGLGKKLRISIFDELDRIRFFDTVGKCT